MQYGIPRPVTERLPGYLRRLQEMQANGATTASSHEMALPLGVTPALIRKDLSYFGRLGTQGSGYPVGDLIERLEDILGIGRRWKMAMIGSGGMALTLSLIQRGTFEPAGFHLARVYDVDPDRIGQMLQDIEVLDFARFAEDSIDDPVDIVILAVANRAAREVAARLVEAGVPAILNYTAVEVHAPPGVEVRHVNPVLALQTMTFHLARQDEDAVEWWGPPPGDAPSP